MNHFFIASFTTLLIAVGCIIGAVFWNRNYDMKNLKTKKDCEDPKQIGKVCGQDKTCCGVWDGSQCRKGKIGSGGNTCAAKGHKGPAILAFGGGGLFLVASIVLFSIGFSKRD